MRLRDLKTICVLMLFVLGPRGSAVGQQTSKSVGSSALLTNQDIILMTRSKFDDATIIKTVQSFETNFDLSVAALVTLKDAGVSQTVMQAMLDTPSKTPEGRVAERDEHEHTARTADAASPTDSDKQREYSAKQLQPGTYYWTQGSWHLMQQLTMSGGGATHMAKMFVPGLTPQMVWTFRGPNAPVQIKESEPLFCVKFIAVPPGLPYAPSPRDITIAKFDEKKDRRELQVTSGGNLLTFKAGLGKDRLPDLMVTPLDGATVLFSPTAPLRAGEYIISTVSMGMTGYDFGFHPAKSK
jgi:hypothetical protein